MGGVSLGMATALDPPARAARRISLLLALIALACDDHSAVRPLAGPPEPAVVPPALKDGTISGTVYEHGTTRRALGGGIRLTLQTFTPNARMGTVSDADGHYEFTDVPAHAAVIIAPPLDSDYRAPCPAGTDSYRGAGMRLDVHVVSTSVLATTGPVSLPTTRPFVLGTVSGPSGPVASASVEMGDVGGIGDAWAATLTARNGGFVMCVAPPGVGADQVAEVRITKDGYWPLAQVVSLGWDGLVGFRLVPR